MHILYSNYTKTHNLILLINRKDLKICKRFYQRFEVEVTRDKNIVKQLFYNEVSHLVCCTMSTGKTKCGLNASIFHKVR